MLDFIVFICFIAFFAFFPYKKTYILLSQYVDVKLLFSALLLISYRFIYALFLPEADEVKTAAPPHSADFADRMNFTLGSMADGFGWMCLIAGIILLLVVIWQAIEKKKENRNELPGVRPDDKD